MVTFISWIWAGVVIGVSFIATPAKFLAPSLSLQHALEVGRLTFFVLRWVELGIIVVLLILLLQRGSLIVRALCVALASLLIVQYGLLLPLLDARVELLLQGQELTQSSLHYLYISVEILKVICLLMIGFYARKLELE